MPFQILNHTGDTAIEISGSSEEDLFGETCRALFSIIVDCEKEEFPRPEEAKKIDMEAEDGESLLVDFLNELIFLFDSSGFLGCDLQIESISLEKTSHLRATLKGERYDPDRPIYLTEVKAATFHGVEIEKTPDGVRAVVVFDL